MCIRVGGWLAGRQTLLPALCNVAMVGEGVRLWLPRILVAVVVLAKTEAGFLRVNIPVNI